MWTWAIKILAYLSAFTYPLVAFLADRFQIFQRLERFGLRMQLRCISFLVGTYADINTQLDIAIDREMQTTRIDAIRDALRQFELIVYRS
jgi:hypothetical protein